MPREHEKREDALNGQRVGAELCRRSLISVDRDVLGDLLEAAEVLRQDETCVTGWIRILSVDGAIVVQEETQDGDVLLRRMPSVEAARRVVEHRLASYERMWDGCGCKIDYFDGSSNGGG